MGVPKVSIDETTHVYKRLLNGIVAPSNTQVLTFANPAIKSKYYTEDGREVGKAAHLGCRFYDEGRLDWASLETPRGATERAARLMAKVRGRVQSYVAFRKDTGFEPDLIEYVTYSEALDVAGTIDRTGTFPPSPVIWLIDLKGGAVQEWHGEQTAGYTLMEFPGSHEGIMRGALYLKDNGARAQLKVHTDIEDFRKFVDAAKKFHRENPK